MSIANPYLTAAAPGDRHNMKLRRQASIASLTVASILIVAKLITYMMTDSVSIMTSLMDSTFDAVASTVTMLSVLHAATPADEDHRFGHGKLEALSALGQAVFIFGSAGYLFFESVHRFIQPQKVAEPQLGIGVMLLSLALTGVLIAFQRHVIRKTGSVAISADYLHYSGDLLMNLGVLAAVTLSYYSDWLYFDPLFAGVISLVLLYNARRVGGESFDILMDKELSEEDRAKIEALVKSHPAACAMHDLRTRTSGQQIFIEFHLELDGALSLKNAHDITEEIELILYKSFPTAEVLIHEEPAGIDDHRLDTLIKPA